MGSPTKMAPVEVSSSVAKFIAAENVCRPMITTSPPGRFTRCVLLEHREQGTVRRVVAPGVVAQVDDDTGGAVVEPGDDGIGGVLDGVRLRLVGRTSLYWRYTTGPSGPSSVVHQNGSSRREQGERLGQLGSPTGIRAVAGDERVPVDDRWVDLEPVAGDGLHSKPGRSSSSTIPVASSTSGVIRSIGTTPSMVASLSWEA